MNIDREDLLEFAWMVRRMRDLQREFERSGDLHSAQRMRAMERDVDDKCEELTLPPVIPFANGGGK